MYVDDRKACIMMSNDGVTNCSIASVLSKNDLAKKTPNVKVA